MRAAEYLEADRSKRGRTREAQAAELGVHTATLGRWESGSRTPSLHWAIRMAELWGIPPEAWRAPKPRGNGGPF